MDFKEIKTYEDACKVNKQDPAQLPDVSMLSEEEAKDVITTLKVKRIVRALNTDPETGKVWEPNWNDHSEYKYSPWIEVEASEEKPGGFGFSDSDCDSWLTGAAAGSRLCLESRDRVMLLHEHFKPLLIEYYLIIR